MLEDIVEVVDGNRVVRSVDPYGEPQLGRAVCTGRSAAPTSPISSWQCYGFSTSPTGGTALLDVAERSGLGVAAVAAAAELLEQHGLVEEPLSGG